MKLSSVNRRDFLQLSAAVCASPLAVHSWAVEAQPPKPLSHWCMRLDDSQATETGRVRLDRGN